MSQAWADSFARVAKKSNCRAWLGTLKLQLHTTSRNCGYSSPTRNWIRQHACNSGQIRSTGFGQARSCAAPIKSYLRISRVTNCFHCWSGDLRRCQKRCKSWWDKAKRIASAQEVQASKRQKYSAGPHAAFGQFKVGLNVLDNIVERERVQEGKKVSEREGKKLREYWALRSKVSAIKEQNTSHEQLTVAQLKVMVMWYKSNGDLPTPTTRSLLLCWLQEACVRNDPPEPPVPSVQRAAPESEGLQNEMFPEVCMWWSKERLIFTEHLNVVLVQESG